MPSNIGPEPGTINDQASIVHARASRNPGRVDRGERILEGMKDKHAWAPVDPLGEALHFLRMSGTFYCRSELTTPWALALPPMNGCLSFHVVTSGRCLLEVEG